MRSKVPSESLDFPAARVRTAAPAAKPAFSRLLVSACFIFSSRRVSSGNHMCATTMCTWLGQPASRASWEPSPPPRNLVRWGARLPPGEGVEVRPASHTSPCSWVTSAACARVSSGAGCLDLLRKPPPRCVLLLLISLPWTPKSLKYSFVLEGARCFEVDRGKNGNADYWLGGDSLVFVYFAYPFNPNSLNGLRLSLASQNFLCNVIVRCWKNLSKKWELKNRQVN